MLIDEFIKKYINPEIITILIQSIFWQDVVKPLFDKRTQCHINYPEYEKISRPIYFKDTFVSKSPDELYKWWIEKATQNFESENWNLEDVYKITYINLVLRFITYCKNNVLTQEQITKFKIFIIELDRFVNGKWSYSLVLPVMVSYIILCKHIYGTRKECADAISKITILHNATRYKPCILLPLTLAPNESKMVNLYSIPIIPFITTDINVHGYTHPCWVSSHDLSIHHYSYAYMLDIINDYDNITLYQQYFNPIKSCLQEIFNLQNNYYVYILLFLLLHESTFGTISFYIPNTYFKNNNYNLFYFIYYLEIIPDDFNMTEQYLSTLQLNHHALRNGFEKRIEYFINNLTQFNRNNINKDDLIREFYIAKLQLLSILKRHLAQIIYTYPPKIEQMPEIKRTSEIKQLSQEQKIQTKSYIERIKNECNKYDNPLDCTNNNCFYTKNKCVPTYASIVEPYMWQENKKKYLEL